MSTTTVSYSATTEEVSLRELRRREEKAREALRRRLGKAQKAIAVQEARYAKLVELLDKERARLPDLAFTAPALPSAAAGQDPTELEKHASMVSQLVDALEHQTRAAIAAAEVALERRRKLASAWTEVHNTLSEIAVRNRACTALASQLHEPFDAVTSKRPDETATLEEAQAALQSLRGILDRLQEQQISLERRVQVRKTVRSLSGSSLVRAVSAVERLDAWDAKKASEAKARAKRTVNEAMALAKINMEDLPIALQLQATLAIEQAHLTDSSRQVADLINRHRVRLNAIEMAERMLANPPQYTDDTTGAMENRWRNLVRCLESVICGLDDWSNSLEFEYRQVQEDCTRAMQRAYAKANFIDAAVDSGFQVFGDGDDLVLMDLEGFPGYYIEVRNEPTDEGYAAVTELKADHSVSGARDAEVTETVCKKLQAMAHSPDTKVNSGVEVLERKPVVTRARRPASTRQRARAKLIDPNS
jgi:hypothetical protein